MQMHKQEWANHEANEAMKRESHQEAHASTSTTQEADSSKASQPGLAKILPKIEMPGGAMLYPGVLGLDGIGNNMGLASSSSQPQFITIPLSMANMAMAGANSANGCSSDDSSELQDLSTGRK
ncbi:Uncharacterized protein OBRU01_10356 [Operophtera brumata]|uniref:Uncharacterized protein n=1 Tax=Operophtera brumata TaxID=104452 RepID=A0A0L7L356_OPEBR|nr:Uncharacterized protein OBRU01_10356 [Operophtera brumata]